MWFRWQTAHKHIEYHDFILDGFQKEQEKNTTWTPAALLHSWNNAKRFLQFPHLWAPLQGLSLATYATCKGTTTISTDVTCLCVLIYTLPETKPASWHLNIDAWKTMEMSWNRMAYFQGQTCWLRFRKGVPNLKQNPEIFNFFNVDYIGISYHDDMR